MVTQGPDDPMCCPTQQVVKTYALEGNQLVWIGSQLTIQLSPTTLVACPPDPLENEYLAMLSDVNRTSWRVRTWYC